MGRLVRVVAEVGGDDGRVAQDLVGRALGDPLAEVQDEDPVRDARRRRGRGARS